MARRSQSGGATPASERSRPRTVAAGAASRRDAPLTADEIRVRMYRLGLGDCFLVTLRQRDGKSFHMMIDCGVILGTKDATVWLKAAVDDIIEETNGTIDVLVVTHEHYDHIAGFVLCDEKFALAGEPAVGKLSVREVWFAWTEKPGDELADRLRSQRQARKDALAGLAARLDAMGVADRVDASQVAEALRFFGVDTTGADAAKRDRVGATARAMDNASKLAGTTKYWEPGDVWTSESAPGIKVYVLGPPRDERAFRKTDSATEVYHLDTAFLEDAVAMAAASGSNAEQEDLYAPFERAHRRSLSALAAGKVAGTSATLIHERYFGHGAAAPETDVSWRRIDNAWLGSAEQLALALDSATNNTSLALAIELVDTGKVLLFPADAQVGNWLSWHSLRWKEGDRTVTAADLLARTQFYKVGHHGSHNATLKSKGVEMMLRSDVISFIPVDQEMAKAKRWFEMPAKPLEAALLERFGNAIIRIDKELPSGIPSLRSGGKPGPFGDLYHEWTQPL